MNAVLALLQERSTLSLHELCAELGVSAATLRRDLAELDGQGLLIRTHGGARERDERRELPVGLRDPRAREAKRLIGRRAAEMIPPGRYALAVSGGTTTAEVARSLSERDELTIVTNSLTIAVECAAGTRITVIMTGGVVRQNSFEAVGALSESAFNAINVGTAVLGADGISVAGGVTTYDEVEARTNHAMVAKAQRVIVVADGSKVGKATFAKMADLSEIDELVTDSTADAAVLRQLADAGLIVHVVELPAA